MAENLVLNQNFLNDFTMTFIGNSNIFRLMKKSNKITAQTVDSELSYNILYHIKGSGHPLYKKIDIPKFEDFTIHIQSLSKRAINNFIISDDAVTRVMESQIKIKNLNIQCYFRYIKSHNKMRNVFRQYQS